MVETEKMFAKLAKLGVCKTGQRLWKLSPRDLNTIIKVWKGWPEFLIEHGDNALGIVRFFIKDKVDYELLEANNIFVDCAAIKKTVQNDRAVMISGVSNGTIRVSRWGLVKAYLFNESHIKFECEENSILYVELYNNTTAEIILAENAKCTVYQYDNSRVLSDKNIVIHKKEYVRGGTFNGKELPDYKNVKLYK